MAALFVTTSFRFQLSFSLEIQKKRVSIEVCLIQDMLKEDLAKKSVCFQINKRLIHAALVMCSTAYQPVRRVCLDVEALQKLAHVSCVMVKEIPGL